VIREKNPEANSWSAVVSAQELHPVSASPWSARCRGSQSLRCWSCACLCRAWSFAFTSGSGLSTSRSSSCAAAAYVALALDSRCWVRLTSLARSLARGQHDVPPTGTAHSAHLFSSFLSPGACLSTMRASSPASGMDMAFRHHCPPKSAQ
jgi:hypothetical protein